MSDRYALISRWTSAEFSADKIISMYDYNDFVYSALTDFHAFDSTHDLFIYFIQEYFNKLEEVYNNKEFKAMSYNNFGELIEKLMLGIRLDSSFLPSDKALAILEKFLILFKAEKTNCGRSAATFLYKNLWKDCILPLLKHLHIKYII